ncbi:DUF423 domain-containing protein [Novilysobacter spongiicola]|uniref:Uncharacterized membrane protein YgdD, TMEM256/DUF423 family n=1 Tax=Lysobacter spongiicola DSM 21749 TaxID=1122188 RepID=A0A1T4N9K1_9GAMM|nr:Uncharacterized membrane protein YgdD, TMEM256/DUF423 family [Lysobacter spongiicola DSM 21749]
MNPADASRLRPDSVPVTRVRLFGFAGGLLAAASVALAAYAAHAADPAARASLQSAALFAFGHGIALTTLAPRALPRLAAAALGLLLLGTLMFSGTLVAAHFLQLPTALAPVGGGLMIVAWLLWAAHAARR